MEQNRLLHGIQNCQVIRTIIWGGGGGLAQECMGTCSGEYSACSCFGGCCETTFHTNDLVIKKQDSGCAHTCTHIRVINSVIEESVKRFLFEPSSPAGRRRQPESLKQLSNRKDGKVRVCFIALILKVVFCMVDVNENERCTYMVQPPSCYISSPGGGQDHMQPLYC